MNAIITVVGKDKVGIMAGVCVVLQKINVNILDKETILAAHHNPAAYPELVVRVTGFTAYFSMLSPKFRQLVVDRLLEN